MQWRNEVMEMKVDEKYMLKIESTSSYINYSILVVDEEGIITNCNKSFSQLLKTSKSDLINENMQLFLPTLKLGKEKDHLTVKNKECLCYQLPLFDKNDKERTLILIDDNFHQLTEQIIDKYEDALTSLSECILSIDRNGKIDFISRSYAGLLGITDRDFVIGKHCTEVISNSRLHTVMETKKAEIGHLMNIKGKTMMASRLPRYENGKIVGAIGKIMFHDLDEFKALINQVQDMESKIAFYEKEIKRIQGAKYSFESIVGNSLQIEEVKHIAKKAARSKTTVLIKGETGTGKELFAHAIHYNSPRSVGPFIPVNCAAIPKDLLEAELFGYEDGAFTGAKQGGKPGKFELANNGTLFLDEIGDMPLEMQAKLLRVLENKELERIGGTTAKSINVRIIAATNKDLWKMTNEGEFREDLYYRLNVFMLEIPPLSERKDDIPLIADYLIKKLNKRLDLQVVSLNQEVKQSLMKYHWPGNIRELANLLERSMNMIDDEQIITMHHLPVYSNRKSSFSVSKEVYSLKEQMDMTEKRAIIAALNKAKGNKEEAATLLDIHRASLYRKLKKYNLD